MTDTAREEALNKLAEFLSDDFFGKPQGLDARLAHLPLESLSDAVVISERSQWDLSGLGLMGRILAPMNGAYRIALMKRLTDINIGFMNPWIVEGFFGDSMGVDDFSLEDINDDHMAWAAVAMLVGGGNYAMFHDEDLGFLREPVEDAQHFLKLNWNHRESIREIIMTRRVYKPEDIEALMTGGEPLHKGAL